MDQQAALPVPLIADSHRWDAWRQQAAHEGFVSALAVPALVDADADVAIALNLYSRSPDPWTPELLRAADGFVQLGTAMVRLHLELADLKDATADTYRNMSDAIAVERAIGVIMHTNDCTQQDTRRLLTGWATPSSFVV